MLSVGAMVAALAAGVAPASGAGAKVPRLRNLDPGGPARFREKVPVNLVFVGYERDQVSKRRVLAGLPRSYKPVDRNRLLYGVTRRLGITYTYDYDVTYASTAYEDRFFATLSRLARPAPLTEPMPCWRSYAATPSRPSGICARSSMTCGRRRWTNWACWGRSANRSTGSLAKGSRSA